MRVYNDFDMFGEEAATTPSTLDRIFVPEILVREPRLLIPGVKPVGPVAIDATSRYAKGIVIWPSGGGAVQAFFDGEPYLCPTLSGDSMPALDTRNGKKSFYYASTHTRVGGPQYLVDPTTQGATVLAIFNVSTMSNFGTPCNWMGVADDARIEISIRSSTFIASYGSAWATYSSIAFPFNEWVCAAISISDSAKQIDFACFGEDTGLKVDTITSGSSYHTSETNDYGTIDLARGAAASSGRRLTGSVGMQGFWPMSSTRNQLVDLVKDPYQFLVPRRA